MVEKMIQELTSKDKSSSMFPKEHAEFLIIALIKILEAQKNKEFNINILDIINFDPSQYALDVYGLYFNCRLRLDKKENVNKEFASSLEPCAAAIVAEAKKISFSYANQPPLFMLREVEDKFPGQAMLMVFSVDGHTWQEKTSKVIQAYLAWKSKDGEEAVGS